MINAIIVDDEQHSIDRLVFLLKENCSRSVKVLGTYTSVDEGIPAVQHLKPDLVFLDVQMGSKTGFDLLQQLDKINFEIIFITAYEKYAVQAFRFSAFDYLLKPVNQNEFLQTLDKLKEKFSQSEQSKKLETLFYNLKNLNGVSKKISIPTGSGLIFPEVNNIIPM